MTADAPLIHVIDDDDSVRKAVTRLLKAAGYEVQAYASAGEFMIGQRRQAPGCIILDVRMPGPSGLELQAALARQESDLPIIFLTGHGDIRMSVQAMKSGAIDFLTKPVERQSLLAAVANALETQRSSRAKRERVEMLRSCYDQLSDREREIFRMVVEGKLNKQIAVALNLAERTVKAHRAQVMEKMQAASLAELVRAAEQLEQAAAEQLEQARYALKGNATCP